MSDTTITDHIDADPIDGITDTSEDNRNTDYSTLDVDEYADFRVPVKYDGEEHQVSLSEAISGYQRQSDYTRKTQELAEQRESLAFASNLQSALENDPRATLEGLARHYNITPARDRDFMEDSYEDLDPTELKMRDMEARLAQFEEHQSAQAIEKEISRLQSKYDDFDTNKIIAAAIRGNTNDLESVYKQEAFDRFMKQKELDTLAGVAQATKDLKVLEAKRAAGAVSGGSSATSSTTTSSVSPITSISDAWAAAKKELNATF